MKNAFNFLALLVGIALCTVQYVAYAGELYEQVDPSELSFTIKDFYYDAIVDSPGVAKPIGREVGEFFCEGHKLELKSKQFEDGFIVTVDYGKIKIQFSSSLSGSSFALWLTHEQKKALKALKSKLKKAKHRFA